MILSATEEQMGEIFTPFIGIFMIGYGVWWRRQIEIELDKMRRSISWPHIKGEITRSEVVMEQDRPGGVFSAEARIEYAYTVNECRYEADTPILGATVEVGDGPANALCARFPMGATVDVHYDPMDPTVAFLERSDTDPRFIRWIGSGMTILGLILVVRGCIWLFG
jgi:hypothetical protein